MAWSGQAELEIQKKIQEDFERYGAEASARLGTFRQARLSVRIDPNVDESYFSERFVAKHAKLIKFHGSGVLYEECDTGIVGEAAAKVCFGKTKLRLHLPVHRRRHYIADLLIGRHLLVELGYIGIVQDFSCVSLDLPNYGLVGFHGHFAGIFELAVKVDRPETARRRY